jgi:hypothetical protein
VGIYLLAEERLPMQIPGGHYIWVGRGRSGLCLEPQVSLRFETQLPRYAAGQGICAACGSSAYAALIANSVGIMTIPRLKLFRATSIAFTVVIPPGRE